VINQPVTVVGQLSDASVDPATPLSGQTLNFTLAGSTCTATTDSSGNASCQVTPSQVGTGTLSAAFAGSSTLVAAAGSSAFLVLAAAAPAPTVTLSVSPTSVAAGGSATLTWSSTNATACTASGSWSGTEATSGTQSVTPADVGSYTYTLTCTGNGGSAAASAVLSANLVTVTVTAKSGGGSFGGYLCLCLGLLVMLRLYAVLTARKILLMNDEISKSRSLRAGGLLNSEITTTVLALTASVVVLTAGAGVSRAAGSSLDDPGSPLNHLYVGVRVGSMPVRLDSSKLDQGLATLGYGSVSASTDTSAVGGTAYMGYEFTPHLDAEIGYTHRNANVARLSGAIASTASLTPLLQDTAQLIRGYGNLYSLSLRGRFELAPRFSLDPRLGGFFWDTKVMAVGDAISIDTTHRGGGVTVGLGASYRVWRGLALGIGVDHFRGFPNNIATLYGASLEWRFGQAARSD
jgi:PKD repeat protein